MTVIKFSRTKLEGHVAHMGEIRMAYKIRTKKPETKRRFGGILTRFSEMDYKGVGKISL